MKTCLFLCFSLSTFAQIEPPILGWMLDLTGTVRPVSGIAGSVTLGEPRLNSVASLGCAAGSCLVKTDTSIVSSTGSVSAPGGPAMFAFDGTAALVYFPDSKQLARWHDDQLDPLTFSITGEILSIRSTSAGPVFAVRRPDGVWLVGDGNVVRDALPRMIGPVILLDAGVLYATRDAIVLRRADASELRFPLHRAMSFSAMGPGYVEVRAAGSTYALRTDPGREQLFQLPDPAKEPAQ